MAESFFYRSVRRFVQVKDQGASMFWQLRAAIRPIRFGRSNKEDSGGKTLYNIRPAVTRNKLNSTELIVLIFPCFTVLGCARVPASFQCYGLCFLSSEDEVSGSDMTIIPHPCVSNDVEGTYAPRYLHILTCID